MTFQFPPQFRHMPELNAILQRSSVGILFTRNKTITHCNTALENMFGQTMAEMVGQTAASMFSSAENYQAFATLAQSRLREQLPFEVNWPFQLTSGRTLLCRIRAQGINPSLENEETVWLIEDITESVSQAEAIQRSVRELDAVMKNAPVSIIFTAHRRLTKVNAEFCKTFGYSHEHALALNGVDLFPSKDIYSELSAVAGPRLSQGLPVEHETYMARSDGSRFWAQLVAYVVNPEQTSEGTIWLITDRTESKRHEEAMQQAIQERIAVEEDLVNAKALMQAVFDCAKVSIIVTDATGTIELMNQTAQTWLGYDQVELVGLESPRLIHDPDEVVAHATELTEELGVHVAPGFDTFVAKARLVGSDVHEWTYIRKDGSRFPVHLTTSVLKKVAGEINGYIGVAVDITDRRRADEATREAQSQLEERVAQRTAELAAANQKLQAEIVQRQAIEEKMRSMAHFDALTGLPNRRLLLDRMDLALAVGKRHQRGVGLMFIDLDRFKWVNDTFGHDTGDQLLQAVAQKMSAVLRESDTLARHGGDEFVLLVTDMASPAQLASIADKIIAALSEPITVGAHHLKTTPSIGIASHPLDGEDSATLLQHADLAMYAAKANGKNQHKFFTPDMRP